MRAMDGAGEPLLGLMQGRLAETAQGGAFFGVYVEDGVKLGELKKIVNFFGQVQQFQFATAALCGGICAHELADPGTVDVIHVSEIEHNMDTLFIQQATNSLA